LDAANGLAPWMTHGALPPFALKRLPPSFLRAAGSPRSRFAAPTPILAEGQRVACATQNPTEIEMKNTAHTIAPRIYVACLAAYNSGYLHGAWIDANQDGDGIRDDIAAMLKTSPIAGAEEYAIHDYEGFESVRIEEYTSIDTVTEIAAFIAEHGELGAAVLAYFSNDMDEAQEAMADRYHGQFTSLADYMEEMTTDTLTIPEPLRYYIDWQAMARDAELSGDLFTIETAYDEVHVFSRA